MKNTRPDRVVVVQKKVGDHTYLLYRLSNGYSVEWEDGTVLMTFTNLTDAIKYFKEKTR